MLLYITTCDERLSYAMKMKAMLARSPYPYVFVYGRGNRHRLNPYIEIPVKESYENLSSKTYFLVKHFLTQNDPQLVKLNDDTFLDFDKLKRYESATQDYIGFFHSFHDARFSKFFHWYKVKNPAFRVFKQIVSCNYAEGAMYILSRKACERIVQFGEDYFTSTPETYLGEDVRVGMALDDPSIVKWDIKHPNDLDYEITEDFMSIHPVSLLMFDKLAEAETNEAKMEVLTKFYSLNENARRNKYLEAMEKELVQNTDGDVSQSSVA